MIMNFEIDYLFVTGNGFDMDLGLNTSYSKFVESEEWMIMRNKRKQENPNPSLIDYIEYEHKIGKEEGWFDLESAMLHYVLPNDEGHFIDNAEEDKIDYNVICKALVEYLCNLFWKPEPIKVVHKMSNSFAGYLLSLFFDPMSSSGRNVMYTFNYTPLEIIYSNVGGLPTTDVFFNIHGAISKDDFLNKRYDGTSIILGIMTDEQIAPGYSFLKKSKHPQYIATPIEHDLVSARNVIIFGHSLNQMDFGYFKRYFEMLESNTDKERTLTIVTKNDESKDKLLNNIRTNGISVKDVEEHIKIEYGLTDNWNKQL